MTRLILSGCSGRMGRAVEAVCAAQPDMEIAAGFDLLGAGERDFPVFSTPGDCDKQADVLIDFSRPDALNDILAFAEKSGCALVLATTGYSAEQQAKIDAMSAKVPVFRASNFSLGINLLIDLAKKAASVLGLFYDVEIVEAHHNMKVDAPSGTAVTIAEEVAAQYEGGKQFVYGRHETNKRRDVHEMGIHSIRGGTIVGKHDVMFIGKDEVITISHEAQSRMVFAVGAVRAAKFVAGKPAGKYTMSMMLSN